MGVGAIVGIVIAVFVVVGVLLAHMLCKRYGWRKPEEQDKE